MVPLPSTPGSGDHHLFTRLSEELMSCRIVSSAGWEEEEWAALESSKPSELISIRARSQRLLPWGGREGVGWLRKNTSREEGAGSHSKS